MCTWMCGHHDHLGSMDLEIRRLVCTCVCVRRLGSMSTEPPPRICMCVGSRYLGRMGMKQRHLACLCMCSRSPGSSEADNHLLEVDVVTPPSWTRMRLQAVGDSPWIILILEGRRHSTRITARGRPIRRCTLTAPSFLCLTGELLGPRPLERGRICGCGEWLRAASRRRRSDNRARSPTRQAWSASTCTTPCAWVCAAIT